MSGVLEFWTSLDPEIKAVFLTAVISLIAAIIKYAISPKAKILWGISHQHCYLIANDANNTLSIRTREIFVQNIGRIKSENIEIAMNFKPRHIETWPPLEREDVYLPDGRPLVKFKKLGPKEFMTIHMLNDVGELPDILYIKHSDGNASEVRMGPMRILPKPVLFIIASLIFVGFLSSIFYFIRIIQIIG